MAVHRYKASESTDSDDVVEKKPAPAKRVVKTTTKKSSKVKAEKVVKERKANKFLAPFKAIGGYFVGSWQELRLVRWPNRKQTWAMTLAVLLFSLGLGVIIFLLDALFTFVFKKFIF